MSSIIKSIPIGTTKEKGGSGPGANGIAFSDGKNNQNPSALPKGGRDVIWADFGGSLEVLTTVAAFELNVNFAPIGKGTNGGRATIENKADDAITAVDNSINAGKALKETVDKQKNKENVKDSNIKKDSIRTTYYDKGGTEIRTEIRAKKDNE